MDELTKEEVLHVAHLARIDVAEEDINKYKIQLKQILDEINRINELDVDGDILISPTDNKNVYREDVGINEDVCFNLWYWLCSENKTVIKDSLYLWKNNPNSITRRNNNSYTWESFIPLCENLIITYKNIINSGLVSEEKLIASFANRLVRLYIGYNNFHDVADPNIPVSDMLKALQKFFQEVIKPYWDKITDEDILSAWREINSKDSPDFIPSLGLREFLKKIREE